MLTVVRKRYLKLDIKGHSLLKQLSRTVEYVF